MTALDATLAPREIPGAFETHLVERMSDGSLIEFEQAPAGWLAKIGEPRLKPWRAYFHTPAGPCTTCEGSGRVPGATARGKQCPFCKGAGTPRRHRLDSVTTLLGQVVPKAGLTRWAEGHGIRGTVEAMHRGLIDGLGDPERAVEAVRRNGLGADGARDRAADRGLNVHALLETYMLSGSPPSPRDHPEEHRGYVRALMAWIVATEPEPVFVERLVADPARGYAGRMDLMARVDGRLVAFDAKTQERGGVFASAHLQLRMYVDALVRDGGDVPDDLRVVVFAADGSFREAACLASSEAVSAALGYAALLGPIDRACEAQNRVEREARKNAGENARSREGASR